MNPTLMKKQLSINGSVCEYVKLDEKIEFVCNRCGKKKIVRKYAQYQVDGVTKKLCNGCYGNLLSKQGKPD